tara:strand:+ start:689 stop:1696 length:1008 start_codon:yes stop_codon:yes gene_type:complete
MTRFGIIGASGIVGREINKLLIQKFKVPITSIKLYASQQYLNPNIAPNINYIKKFNINDLDNIDILFSCVNGDFSKKYTPEILKKYPNIKIIDNSSAFRYDDNIPLIVPEINGNILKKTDNLIANPNCTTAISVLALHPINELFGINKVIMSTYQAASGAGKAGMEELMFETKNYITKGKCDNNIFQYPLPFNIIPHIDKFQDNKYSNEEMKVVKETKKILNNNDIKLSCTAVRIPTKRSHSMAITVETKNKIDYKKLYNYYNDLNDIIKIEDNIKDNKYPMPIISTKKNEIFVGRIRKSLIYEDYGCDLFVSGDQLLRGAALNSVLIAEKLINL